MLGIYLIQNNNNKKCYVGSSLNVFNRYNEHIAKLKKKEHLNLHLQSAFSKYGIDSFEFSVLEEVKDVTVLLEREQYWIEKYNSYKSKFGYNMIRFPTQPPMLGRNHTTESRSKMSNMRTGYKHSDETKRKIGKGCSVAHKGLKHSEEVKKRIGESVKRTAMRKRLLINL